MNSYKLKNKSSFIMQIKHDYYMGTIKGWKKYAVVLIIFILLCANFQRGLIISREYGNFKEKSTFGNYIIDIYKGVDISNRVDNKEKIEMPPGWILLNIFLSIVIGYYPLNDLKEYGTQILIRSKKRWQWWLSKCLWIMGNVLIFYAIGYIVIAMFSLINGDLSLTPNHNVNLAVLKLDTSSLTAKEVFSIGIVLPIVTSIALSLIQLTIAMFSNSIYSNIFIISLIIVSIYYCSPILMGNYLMMLRNSIMVGVKGIGTSTGIILDMAISFISITLGIFKFRTYDIMGKNN
ncbi:hypothetical protein [Clostridium sp.]|uniref:hypothetical protein n=1 Tax=Clostridium sp. TaxID=1506 RepID=UPI003464182D